MKRRLFTLLVVFVMVFTVACQPAQTSTDPGTTDEGPIKIGYVGALSGETALWGQAGLNGAQMAIDEINAAGGLLGRQLEIVGMDGKGDPLDSVNSLNRLIDNEKVVAVIGTNFSSCNIPMAPIADSKKVPVIATAASNPEVTVDKDGNLHPYSFRIGFTDPFQGRVMAGFAVDELQVKEAAILTNSADPYSVGITEYLKEEYAKLGGTIIADEKAQSGDQDFRAQLTNIKESGASVVFLPWIYKDVALIVKQARDLGLETTFIGADGWDSQDLPELAGDAINGGYFCSRVGFNTPDGADLAKRYEERFKITAEAEILFGYDGVMWLKQVIENAGKADSVSIRDGLENTTSFEGVLGAMSVDPTTHDPVRDAAIFQIQEGNITFIKTYAPQE